MALSRRLGEFLVSIRFAALLLLTSTIGVGLVLLTTSPIALGPSGMLGAFIVFYIWFFAWLIVAAHGMKVLRREKSSDNQPKDQQPLAPQLFIIIAVWAFAPLIFLALQSIGQLDAISVLLVLIFEALATLYITRMRRTVS